MGAMANMMTLWSWPWEAAKTATSLVETAVATQAVLAKRLPMLSAAMTDPLNADHRELSLMVSEKVDAFGQSQRSLTSAGDVMRRAVAANARDLSRVARGELLGPSSWIAMFERNIAFSAAMVALPMSALDPVHRGVTANARRLGR